GGEGDDRHGAPLPVTRTVRALSDGRFVHRGPMMHRLPGRPGPTAGLDVDGVAILPISPPWQTPDPARIRCTGLDPLGHHHLVVNSTIHYRAAFEPIARAIIEVDAPGLSSSNLSRFTFTRVRRPIFPLDPETTYRDDARHPR